MPWHFFVFLFEPQCPGAAQIFAANVFAKATLNDLAHATGHSCCWHGRRRAVDEDNLYIEAIR